MIVNYYSWRIVSISIHLRFQKLDVYHNNCQSEIHPDSFIASNFLAIPINISTDISIQMHQFVCIKLAYIKFGHYLTIKLTW